MLGVAGVTGVDPPVLTVLEEVRVEAAVVTVLEEALCASGLIIGIGEADAVAIGTKVFLSEVAGFL